MKEKLKSRKLWAAVLTAALVAAGDFLGFDKDTTTKIVGIFATYILGQGIADAGNQGKK